MHHYDDTIKTRNGDWTADCNRNRDGLLDSFILARSLEGLRKQAAKLRRQGIEVSTTAYRQVGNGSMCYSERHYNAI